MSNRYILVGPQRRTPARCVDDDLIAWAEWFETADRQVADTRHELFRVSTVFLGLDHRFSGKGPPILFETMAFLTTGGPVDHTTLGSMLATASESIDCVRYATWEDAEIGHQAMVRRMLEHVGVASSQASSYMKGL
jgi:hypothetical protein